MKRKWRWSSKSLFVSRAPSKVVVIEQSTQGDPTYPTPLPDIVHGDTSLDGAAAEDSHGRSKLDKMRRSGSKFLSMVGLQRNSGKPAIGFIEGVLTLMRCPRV